MDTITIPALSDFHAHLRQGELLKAVAPSTARYAGRLLAMPNTTPPIATADQAVPYVELLSELLPETDVRVAVKLLPTTTPEQIFGLRPVPEIVAVKLYPAGATTHSDDGIPGSDLALPARATRLQEQLCAIEKAGLVLCLHGELPQEEEPLQREPEFLPFVEWVLENYPGLRVVLEHVSTREAVTFVRKRYELVGRDMLAATITLHHLRAHLGHLLGTAAPYNDGKIHPHLHCMPCLKQVRDMLALQAAALSGLPCFFLGSDSAPHVRETKETACGCAGVFTAPVLPEVLVDFFSLGVGAAGARDGFLTHHGDSFYRLPPVERRLTLKREEWTVPTEVGGVVPFLAGEKLSWKLVEG